MPENINSLLGEQLQSNPSARLLTGEFDAALLGVVKGAKQLPVPAYDYAACAALLELSDPARSLRGMQQLLQEPGVVFVIKPDRQRLWSEARSGDILLWDAILHPGLCGVVIGADLDRKRALYDEDLSVELVLDSQLASDETEAQQWASARRFYDNNIVNVWLGPATPLFLTRFSPDDAGEEEPEHKPIEQTDHGNQESSQESSEEGGEEIPRQESSEEGG